MYDFGVFNFFTFIVSIFTFGFILIWKQPKYIVHGYNRFLAFQVGFQKKYQSISPSLSICYYERGQRNNSNNPTLLLVHGFSSDKNSFCQLVKFIPKDIHIIAIDLPGHGESTFEFNIDLFLMAYVHHIKKFVDILNLNKNNLHLLGISMGGHIVGLYDVTYPRSLKSLTLICPHGIEHDHDKERLKEFERTGKMVLLPDSIEGFIKMINFVVYKPVDIPRWFAKGIMQIRNAKHSIYKKVADNILQGNRYLLETNIEKIKTPLFLLWGKHDRVFDVSCMNKIKEKLQAPPQKEMILEQCGHAPIIERPRKSAKLIVDFIYSFS